MAMMTIEQAQAVLDMIRRKRTVIYGPATPGTDQVEKVARDAYERDRAEFARIMAVSGKPSGQRTWENIEDEFRRSWQAAATRGIEVTVYP